MGDAAVEPVRVKSRALSSGSVAVHGVQYKLPEALNDSEKHFRLFRKLHHRTANA